MVLTRLQRLRFFKLLDPLAIYANDYLDVIEREELVAGDGRRLDDQGQALVLQELWGNLDVVDRYVEENPNDLTPGELATVRSWRDGLVDDFIVDRFPDGALRFMAGGYAFEVLGISREIEDMLGELPSIVRTVLLPFDGAIVYSEYLLPMQVSLGQGILDMFHDEVESCYREGKLVATAERFLLCASEIREAKLQREIDELAADLAGEEAGGVSEPGQHEGALAGLSDEERERAIQAHEDEVLQGDRSMVDFMEERCTPGSLTTSLYEIMSRQPSLDSAEVDDVIGELDLDDIVAKYDEDKRDQVRAMLSQFVDNMREELTGDGLADRFTDPRRLQGVAEDMSESEIERLEKLISAGGRMSVPVQGFTSLAGLPLPRFGVCHVFHEGDSYEFVMPDEVLAVADQVDWEAARQLDRKRRAFIDFFEQLVELRGVVPFEEAADEYRRAIADGFKTNREVVNELMGAMEADECNVCMLDDDNANDMLLLHYELLWVHRSQRGLDPYDGDLIEKAPVGEMVDNLMHMQEGKAPRVPTPEMLAEPSLFYWKEKQPAVRAMREYLDAHVPDGADDYFFSDKVLEELIDETKWGYSADGVQHFFDILEENGFHPSDGQLNKLLGLWSNMCNSLPIWSNNGWSPYELAEADMNRPLFLNADGSVMKVGRNDPCPCGSGKKYKKCHGR